jgi:hypothetical protein
MKSHKRCTAMKLLEARKAVSDAIGAWATTKVAFLMQKLQIVSTTTQIKSN